MLKSAVKEEGFYKRIIYFSIREGLRGTSAETWGFEGAGKAKARRISLPSTESSQGKGQEAGEDWACTGGLKGGQLVWRKQGREMQ